MMDKIKKVAQFLAPRITTYVVLPSTADRIVEAAHQWSLPEQYELASMAS